MGNPATGPQSNSFKIWAATFLPALLGAIKEFQQNTGGSKSAVLGGGAILTMLFSTLGKLFHDHGYNKASFAAAGSDIEAQLPQLTRDASIAAGFVAHDLPSLSAKVDALATKAAPTVEELKPVVAAVLASFNTPAPPQP